MRFTYEDYIAQGLVPPCRRARYIASSDPVEVGDCWAPDDSTELFVAWEQRVMQTGGKYTYRKWWVPQSEFHKSPMTKPEVTATSRFIKKIPGVPVVQKVIAVKQDGTVKTILNRPA